MNQQKIIDSIVDKLDTENCKIKSISLMVNENQLRDRLSADVASGRRNADIIDKSIARIPMYRELKTVKIDTNEKTVKMIVNEIKAL